MDDLTKDLFCLTCVVTSTIKSVLGQISENTKGIAFIVDESNRLQGVVTDGDIRRAIYNGASIHDGIVNIMNREYVCVQNDTPLKNVLKLFDCDVKIIPVVDANGVIVDYYEFNNNISIPASQPYLNGNELKYLVDAFLSTWISSIGEYLDVFENNFSDYCDCKYGVSTSNGTTALHLALVALGIGPGDEVIVPNITFVATINAVLYTGARPVIVDVEDDGWCILPEDVEMAITEKTKCIIPVHVYGQPCDMDGLMRIANKHNLFVVEDCAEAHGAIYNGKKVGSFGSVGCFSFFGNKVMTTGEGGMCVTNDEILYKKMRHLRDHGKDWDCPGYHDVVGFNYRMTNIQAAIGVAQLERIDDLLEKRKLLEMTYREKLEGVPNIVFQNDCIPKRERITWFVVVTVSTVSLKNNIFSEMKDNRVDIRSFFVPLSEMGIYQDYVFSKTNSIDISRRSFCLPTYYSITDSEIERIVGIIKRNCQVL